MLKEKKERKSSEKDSEIPLHIFTNDRDVPLYTPNCLGFSRLPAASGRNISLPRVVVAVLYTFISKKKNQKSSCQSIFCRFTFLLKQKKKTLFLFASPVALLLFEEKVFPFISLERDSRSSKKKVKKLKR
jgi:hypothetical protein